MAVKPIYAAGLDTGSRRTRLVICVLENSRIRFAGASVRRIAGLDQGRIADQQAVAESITAALREAEQQRRLCASIGGRRAWAAPPFAGANGRGVLELGYVQEIQHVGYSPRHRARLPRATDGRPHGPPTLPAGFRG